MYIDTMATWCCWQLMNMSDANRKLLHCVTVSPVAFRSRTYDLHVEVVSTLLVLLSSVAFPRDHTRDASDVSAHNPFLHMLMAAALGSGKKAYWAPGIVNRLLQNFIDQFQSPSTSKDTGAVLISLQNSTEMSLIKISEASDLAEEAEHFSYMTLEGIGSLASKSVYCHSVLGPLRDDVVTFMCGCAWRCGNL